MDGYGKPQAGALDDLGQARIWMQNLNYLDLQLGWTLDGKRKVFGSKFGPNLA